MGSASLASQEVCGGLEVEKTQIFAGGLPISVRSLSSPHGFTFGPCGIQSGSCFSEAAFKPGNARGEELKEQWEPEAKIRSSMKGCLR